MFISIIIPTLNEEDCIRKILTYLNAHPKRDQFEVLIVDGGSTDNTCEVIKSHGFDLIHTDTASRAHQMNEGARRANGDVLFFVHADVQLVDSFVDDIESHVDIGVQSGCYRFKFLNPKNPLLHINGFFTRFPFKWCRGGDQTLFITREAFDQISGFDERFVVMEDYDILDRIEQNDISFRIVPKSVKVSARKYNSNSYMKVQFANLQAMKMYKRGFDPYDIREYYYQKLNGKHKSE